MIIESLLLYDAPLDIIYIKDGFNIVVLKGRFNRLVTSINSEI